MSSSNHHPIEHILKFSMTSFRFKIIRDLEAGPYIDTCVHDSAGPAAQPDRSPASGLVGRIKLGNRAQPTRPSTLLGCACWYWNMSAYCELTMHYGIQLIYVEVGMYVVSLPVINGTLSGLILRPYAIPTVWDGEAGSNAGSAPLHRLPLELLLAGTGTDTARQTGRRCSANGTQSESHFLEATQRSKNLGDPQNP
jgi:hypothetical protein